MIKSVAALKLFASSMQDEDILRSLYVLSFNDIPNKDFSIKEAITRRADAKEKLNLVERQLIAKEVCTVLKNASALFDSELANITNNDNDFIQPKNPEFIKSAKFGLLANVNGKYHLVNPLTNRVASEFIIEAADERYAKLHELVGQYRKENKISYFNESDGMMVLTGSPEVINDLEHKVKDIGYYCEAVNEETGEEGEIPEYSLKVFIDKVASKEDSVEKKADPDKYLPDTWGSDTIFDGENLRVDVTVSGLSYANESGGYPGGYSFYNSYNKLIANQKIYTNNDGYALGGIEFFDADANKPLPKTLEDNEPTYSKFGISEDTWAEALQAVQNDFQKRYEEASPAQDLKGLNVKDTDDTNPNLKKDNPNFKLSNEMDSNLEKTTSKTISLQASESLNKYGEVVYSDDDGYYITIHTEDDSDSGIVVFMCWLFKKSEKYPMEDIVTFESVSDSNFKNNKINFANKLSADDLSNFGLTNEKLSQLSDVANEYISNKIDGNSSKKSEELVNDIDKESKVVKKDDKYQAQSEKGKNFGTYDTKEEAENRVKQMEMFKHMDKDASKEIPMFVVDASEVENVKVYADNKLIDTCKTVSAAFEKVEEKIDFEKELMEAGESKGKKDKVNKEQLEMGKKVEKEHTTNPEIAEKITRDHLAEIPDYYTHLKEMEDNAKKNNEVKSSYAPFITIDATTTDEVKIVAGEKVVGTCKTIQAAFEKSANEFAYDGNEGARTTHKIYEDEKIIITAEDQSDEYFVTLYVGGLDQYPVHGKSINKERLMADADKVNFSETESEENPRLKEFGVTLEMLAKADEEATKVLKGGTDPEGKAEAPVEAATKTEVTKTAEDVEDNVWVVEKTSAPTIDDQLTLDIFYVVNKNTHVVAHDSGFEPFLFPTQKDAQEYADKLNSQKEASAKPELKKEAVVFNRGVERNIEEFPFDSLDSMLSFLEQHGKTIVNITIMQSSVIPEKYKVIGTFLTDEEIEQLEESNFDKEIESSQKENINKKADEDEISDCSKARVFEYQIIKGSDYDGIFYQVYMNISFDGDYFKRGTRLTIYYPKTDSFRHPNDRYPEENACVDAFAKKFIEENKEKLDTDGEVSIVTESTSKSNINKKADEELKQFDMKQELDGQKEFEKQDDSLKNVSIPEEKEDTSEVNEAMSAKPTQNKGESFSASEFGNNLAYIKQNNPEDFESIMANLKQLMVGDQKPMYDFLELWSQNNFQNFTETTRVDPTYERHSQYQEQLKNNVLPKVMEMSEYKKAMEEKVSAEKGA